MTQLTHLDPKVFCACIVDTFMAPNLKQIIRNQREDEEYENNDAVKIHRRDFEKQSDLILKADPIVSEPDYAELMSRLPASCFEGSEVTPDNCDDFIVDSVVLFPPNIEVVRSQAFY